MSRLTRRQFVKLSAGAILVSSLGFGLMGCSSNKQAGDKVNIKLGYLPITDHLTLIGSGNYNFEKVNIEPVKFSSWPEIAEALRAGAIDAAFLLTPIGLRLRQQEVPVQAILLGHRNGSVLTVEAGNRINKVSDLAGKTIAIPSRFSTHYILLQRLLADNGLDPDGVKYLDMAPPEMVQALAAKQIDGFIVAEPFGGQAEIQQVGKVLTLSKDIWPNHICCVLNIQESVIQAHPEAVQELATGLVATGQFIEANRVDASKQSVRYLGQKQEVVEFVLTNPLDRVTYNDLFPSMEDFAATQDYMLEFKVTDKTVDLGKYLEPAFAKKAYS
ncbi:MAG: ABC transporter substrate-binding protein [Clostridia bacterium]|nr:ABC transporter substrate-binding protein [Clostridia bacterium]